MRLSSNSSASGDLRRREFILGFVSSLAIVVVETLILVLSIDSVYVSSVDELLSSPLKLGVYLAYILSVVLIPLASVAFIDFVKKLRSIYKLHIVRSLNFESLGLVERCAKFIPILVSVSLLLMILGIVLKFYELLLFSIVPLAVYLTLILKPVYDVYVHRKNIESELLWFLILLITIESVGANIKLLIEKLRSARILPTITKELLIVDRDSKLYGYSHISALMNRAIATPSNRLSSIFSGYASRLRSGGDVTSWLRSKLAEELMTSEFSMRLYSERISSILGQLMLAVYVILPLISVAVLTLNTHIAALTAIVSTPLLVTLVYISQPKTLNDIPIAKILMSQSLCLVISSLTFYKIIGVHAIAIGWLLTLALTHRYRRIYREIEILDRDSAEIFKMLPELRQNGFDVAKSLEYIASSGIVHDTTAKKLSTALLMLRQGIPLTCIATKIPTHSFLFKFTLFTLGVIYECGRSDPEVLQMLYEYIAKIRTMRTCIGKVSRFFEVFAFINIAILAWIWRSLLPLRESFVLMGLTYHSALDLNTFYLLLYVSILGFSLVSNTIRRGIPMLELRNVLLLVLVIAITPLVIT